MMNIVDNGNYFNTLSLILSITGVIFAIFVFLSYFSRPWFKINNYYINRDNKIIISLINYGYKTIPDIECEIGSSLSSAFNLVHTHNITRPRILLLRRIPDSYIFTTQLYGTYPFLRIRILAPNFLGVIKVFEVIYTIDRCNSRLVIFNKRGFRWMF